MNYPISFSLMSAQAANESESQVLNKLINIKNPPGSPLNCCTN